MKKLKLDYINRDSSREIFNIDLTTTTSQSWQKIEFEDKKEFILKFLPLYCSGQKIVLFDKNHTKLLEFYKQNSVDKIKDIEMVNKDSRLLFFTSGSSGFPVGAFKSSINIDKEIDTLKKILKNQNIKRVVVTVPFVHIYGVLVGLLFPLAMRDITLVVKDDFLPYEIIEEVLKGDTLVVTTPVFIKALNKVSDTQTLSSSIFISSTGPLHVDDVAEFQTKYKTTLMQLFGSTETGAIAYKMGVNHKWKALDKVKLHVEDEKLNISSPYISKYLLDKEIVKVKQPYQTQDIVDVDGDEFVLLGRANKLIKIAGKRISAIEIESMLETIPNVKKAIVTLVYKKELLRSEQILITFVSDKKIEKNIIKEKISQNFGTITIPFKVEYNTTLNYSAMGKVIF